MTSRRALFIVNPVAGGGRAFAWWTSFERQMRLNGSKLTHHLTAGPGEALRLASESANQFEVLVAVGGDGTGLEVASGILAGGSIKAALAVVPFGTGNDLASALSIHNEQDAMRALANGSVRTWDALQIRCCGPGGELSRHALLFGAVGIVSESLRRTTGAVKRVFGRRLAYPVGVLRALWRYRCPRMRVTLDGQVVENQFLLVCASNSESAGGGMKLAPGARMDDGRFDVNLVEALGAWEAMGQLRRVCRGEHISHRKVRYLPGSNLAVEADEPLPVAADGELIGYTPARFEIRLGALKLLGAPGIVRALGPLH